MGVVRYRVETFSVAVLGAFASVAELRRLIAATGRQGRGRTRGRGPRENIALCDPRTGEEYVDENTLIPQNSTVLVHRVAGHPTDAIIALEGTSSGGHAGGRIMSDCHYGRHPLEGETPLPGYVCRIVMFLGILFSIAQWKARHLCLAMSVACAMFLGISFSISQ